MVTRIFAIFLSVLFLVAPALGQSKNTLMGLGMSAELATKLTGAAVPSDQLPLTDNTYNLGSAAKSWKDAHIQGTATIGTGSVTGALTAGTGLTATTGNVAATAGAVSAGTTVTAGTGVTATTGGVTATAGNITATAGDIVSTVGKITSGAGYYIPAADYEAVAATGTATGDGALAAGKFIHRVTASDATKVVTLPACATASIGQVHFLLNDEAAQPLKVCPITGSTLNGGGSGACDSFGSGAPVTCYCQADVTWICG